MYEKEINVCLSFKRFKIVISKFGCDNENVIENNKFRKTVKLLLSVSIHGEEISSIKKKKKSNWNWKDATSESEAAETLNKLISDIIKKLEIPNFDSCDSFTKKIKDPVFKVILKYKNCPRVLEIQKWNQNKSFHFQEV